MKHRHKKKYQQLKNKNLTTEQPVDHRQNKEKSRFLETKENEGINYHNLWDTTKAVLGENLIV